jgi:hypothetical protein
VSRRQKKAPERRNFDASPSFRVLNETLNTKRAQRELKKEEDKEELITRVTTNTIRRKNGFEGFLYSGIKKSHHYYSDTNTTSRKTSITTL